MYSNLGHSTGDSFEERTTPLFVLKILIRARLLLYLYNDCDTSGNAPSFMASAQEEKRKIQNRGGANGTPKLHRHPSPEATRKFEDTAQNHPPPATSPFTTRHHVRADGGIKTSSRDAD